MNVEYVKSNEVYTEGIENTKWEIWIVRHISFQVKILKQIFTIGTKKIQFEILLIDKRNKFIRHKT